MTLDEVARITGRFPHYLKMDIDGGEIPAVNGMNAILEAGTLRSALVEMNFAEASLLITEKFKQYGLDLVQKVHLLPSGCWNYIYKRDG